MAEKSLINLGVSPDSGTGDSARRGGEKINNLFADIYANLGDNPLGNDPSGNNYGYRKTFSEADYKVGELHAAGKWGLVGFRTTGAVTYSTAGYGVSAGGTFIDTNGDGIPNIYDDSEWYFLSRGEQVGLDLSAIANGGKVHIVLPLGFQGDCIKIRDTLRTWQNKEICVWTTPYDFRNSAQVTAWAANTPGITTGGYPDSDAVRIQDVGSSDGFPVFKTSASTVSALTGTYPRIYQKFTHVGGKSPITISNTLLYKSSREVEFVFRGPGEGWIMAVKEGYDQLIEYFDAIDSDIRQIDSDLKKISVGVAFPAAPATSGGPTVSVDSWSASLYRTAKYLVQVSDSANNEYQSSQVLVTHNGTTAFYTEYGIITTSGNILANFNTVISAGNVVFTAVAVAGHNVVITMKREALIV